MHQRQRALVPAGALAASIVALAVPRAHAAGPQLIGTAGPGFDLSIADASGMPVARIEPGTYEIEVRDLSSEHNFHLFGPGVDRTTSLGTRSTETWTVTFVTGRYRAICDPHSTMVADLVVGDPPPGEPPSAPVVAPVPVPAPVRAPAPVKAPAKARAKTPAKAPAKTSAKAPPKAPARPAPARTAPAARPAARR